MNVFDHLLRHCRACCHDCRAYYHECRVQAALDRGDAAGAARAAERLRPLAEGRPGAQFLLARIDVADGRHREALARLRRVVEFWPEDAPAWYAIGVCCDYLEEYHAAALAYQRTLEIAPHWLVALKHLGRCAWRAGRRDLARRALERYCSETGDDEEAHDLLGYLDFEDGHLRQSFSHYAQASRLDPLNPARDRNARVLYSRSALS